MPFLRVIRDKRGYETTYLMDWYREGTRQSSRILYAFRTPGGLRVGRSALDAEALQQIQALHPETTFDWKAVFDSRQVIDAAPEPRRPAGRRRPDDESGPVPQLGAPERPQPQAAAVPPRPPIPSVIEGVTAEERTAFLAHWYPLIRSRVEERATEPSRREALLVLADHLNPSTWTDADQVVAGLQRAAESLERLSRVLTRRRRRSGRGRTAQTPPDGRPGEPANESSDDALDAPNPEESDAPAD